MQYERMFNGAGVEVLTVAQAATLLMLSASRVHQLIAEGSLQGIDTISGKRVLSSEVTRLLATRTPAYRPQERMLTAKL